MRPMIGDRRFWSALGPGILFAGASIGVSHLVQSTRAGALFGLTLVVVVVLANVVKYPAFSFGPRYAASTGTSLLEGYRRQGRWALLLYALVTVLTMFTVQGAVTFVCAGLAVALLGLDVDLLHVAAGILVFCAGLLGVGHYRWLDRVTKVAVAVLTIATFVCTALVLPRIDWSGPWWPEAGFWAEPTSLFFVVALVGWMPTAIDVSVWHSLWTLARWRDTDHRPSLREARLDFDVGYVGAAVLALCFVILGAAVMQGQPIPAPAGAFAEAVIGLYTASLGAWSRPIIGAAAFLTMLSTVLVVVDAFPRALAALVARLRGPERSGEDAVVTLPGVYWGGIVLLAAGSLVLLSQFLERLAALVDLATTLSLLTAPVLAFLNHRAVISTDLSPELRPGQPLVYFSLFGIVALTGLAGLYVYVRFLA